MNVMETSLHYLSERFRSEKKARDFLERKFEKNENQRATINQVIEQLKNDFVINDRRIANSLASRHAHKGNSFIIRLLKKHAIKESVISETLSQLDPEHTRAFTEVKKRLAHAPDEEVSRDLIYRFLQGRRFCNVTAKKVMHTLLQQGFSLKSA